MRKFTPGELPFSEEFAQISVNVKSYGSKGQSWAEEFVKYMKSIVTHPVYANMPDAVNEDGKIQWEAPSNRSGGKFQFTHQKRRDWWINKAREIGIDIKSDKWISKTAKAIHPTGEKPCKRCGLILRLAYVYPRKILILRLQNKFGDNFEVSNIEPINDIIQKAVDLFGVRAIEVFSEILSTPKLEVPNFGGDLDKFLTWIEDVYVPSEPSFLSPGSMSNAPDRFDGFHSFNRCCRGTADKGRAISNLASYITDRRVFEYWSEGDWIAADRLMGLVRTLFKNESNADGGSGPPSADHIGPLSLGFCHRPEFRLLSKEANSAKNNRMTYNDVKDLIRVEKCGERVASWYSKRLWDLRKADVNNDENALRLSKMLRDNQRNAMAMLSMLYEEKEFFFLIHLLELHYGDFKVNFENLRIEHYITVFDSIIKENRNTKYSTEQKARRIRIGFEALRCFREKENRHLLLINEESMRNTVRAVVEILKIRDVIIAVLNNRIESILLPKTGLISEVELRKLIIQLPVNKIELFEECKSILRLEMGKIAESISKRWTDERYVRSSSELLL
jgi:Alw26I/Eco31I/Esp3I family type II restriction endonuclease